MSRLTRDGTAEPISRDQTLRHVRGQGNIHFPCSADHEQDWQCYPIDPYSAIIICDGHILLLTYLTMYYIFVFSSVWCPCMAINVMSVQYNGGLLPDILLLTQCYTATIIEEPV